MNSNFIFFVSMLLLCSFYAYPQRSLPFGTPTTTGFILVFSANGKEAYWTAFDEQKQTSSIFTSVNKNGSWTPRHRTPFSDSLASDTAPFLLPFSLDTLFFTRSLNPKDAKKRDIYRVIRNTQGWTAPERLSISSDSMDYYGSFSRNQNLYFSSSRNGNTDIYVAAYKYGKFSEPKNIGPPINNQYANDNPAIAPSEKYLIFRHENPVEGINDLCVSFKVADLWTSPIKLNDQVNTNDFEFAPVISSDGQTLFFTRVSANAGRTASGFFANDDYQIVVIKIKKLHLASLRRNALRALKSNKQIK